MKTNKIVKHLEDEILSPREVEVATTLNNSTIWRLRRRGDFPEPVRLSPGRVGYRRHEIEQWLSDRSYSSVERLP
jgi:prophage regulatory protein